MNKELEAALNNLWVVVRNVPMKGEEHDQLRNDFMLIKEALEKKKKKPKKTEE